MESRIVQIFNLVPLKRWLIGVGMDLPLGQNCICFAHHMTRIMPDTELKLNKYLHESINDLELVQGHKSHIIGIE